jgi:predicted AAA+ superfamily ATPase
MVYSELMARYSHIKRSSLSGIKQAFLVNPVVALLGPRQCGKSTLAKDYANALKGEVHYFDLEDPRDLNRLENPILALSELTGLIVIDEIQRAPDLFPYLRTLIDKQKRKVHFLILGSASRDLIQQSSESLAGRISYIELTPFNIKEIPNLQKLHLYGGFPLSYLAASESIGEKWRAAYIATFLERDLYEFGFKIAPQTMRRFWIMLTHYHGQILNYSELARSFGVSDMTVRHYLEILTQTFMIRLLQPWHENLSKRQVKAPKLYFRDSGIYHSLLGIHSKKDLSTSPKLGASWEGFALEQVLSGLSLRNEESYFWSTHNQAELDLLTFQNGKRIAYEFKYGDVPLLTTSMKIAANDLALDHLYIVAPKTKKHMLDSSVTALTLEDLFKI